MRNILLIFIDLVLTYGPHGRIDPNCPDYDLNTVCNGICTEKNSKCITICDQTDSECINGCMRAEVSCLERCPCNKDCPNGCNGCENSICGCSDVNENANWNQCLDVNGASLARCIYNCNDNGDCEDECVAQFKGRTADCPCEENCPGGCPCDSYDCEDVSPTIITTTTKPTAKEAVLMLRSNMRSVLIGYNGEMDDDINFNYEDNTEVYNSCSASLNDEMWVFGGLNKKRQMSKVQDCRLTTVGELSFDFAYGACNTFSFGIMLCFSYRARQECHSFNGETFKTEASSKFPHQYVRALGSYRNSPFVTGQWSSRKFGLKTEILNYDSGVWEQAGDYPFSNSNLISQYATASTSESVLIIGGFTGGSPFYSSTIAEYKDGSWKNVGNLAQARGAHGAITSGSVTMVVGGWPNSGTTTNTELWNFDSLESEVMDDFLSRHYRYGIALFLVDANYCSKN